MAAEMVEETAAELNAGLVAAVSGKPAAGLANVARNRAAEATAGTPAVGPAPRRRHRRRDARPELSGSSPSPVSSRKAAACPAKNISAPCRAAS